MLQQMTSNVSLILIEKVSVDRVTVIIFDIYSMFRKMTVCTLTLKNWISRIFPGMSHAKKLTTSATIDLSSIFFLHEIRLSLV